MNAIGDDYMVDIFLGVLANILRTYAIGQFMELLYIEKEITRYKKVLVYCLFIILTSGGYYLFQNMFVNIFTNILGLFMITFLYKGSVLKNCLLVFCIYSVNVIVESLVFSLLSTGNSYNELEKSAKECITSIGIFICVIFLEKTKAVNNKVFRMSFSLWFALLCIPIISIIIIVYLSSGRVVSVYDTKLEVGGILAINMAIFYLYGALQDYYKQKTEREEFLNSLKIYSNQLDVMKVSYQKMRQLSHDMKHHICELKYLANNSDMSALIKYLDEMESHMTNSYEYVSSGNKDLDGTINYLLQTANQVLKHVEVHIAFPENLEIHNFTLNIILGNLLENAIRAASETDKKFLFVDIKVKQGILYIQIENSFNNKLKIRGNKLITTKENEAEHGIGLKSVESVIEEMEGTMNIEWGEDIFKVSVMLFVDSMNKSIG